MLRWNKTESDSEGSQWFDCGAEKKKKTFYPILNESYASGRDCGLIKFLFLNLEN